MLAGQLQVRPTDWARIPLLPSARGGALVMRRVRQRAQGLMPTQQLPSRRQRARHALSERYDEVGMQQVHSYDLCHLLVSQCDSRQQCAIYVHEELAAVTKEVAHFALFRQVAYRNHDRVYCKNCAYVTVRMPILRTLCSQLRLISDKASTSALQVVCTSVYVPICSIEPSTCQMAHIKQ